MMICERTIAGGRAWIMANVIPAAGVAKLSDGGHS
jgi:hypothetical protein